MARAIKIDPDKRTIKYIEIKDGDDLRRVIGGWLTLVRMPKRNEVLYCDEEGLMKCRTPFIIGRCRLVGVGVVICSGEKLTDAKSTLDEVKAMVSFAA